MSLNIISNDCYHSLIDLLGSVISCKEWDMQVGLRQKLILQVSLIDQRR